MADDMTPGEIRRSIDRIEGSQREAHKAIDDRLAEVARKSVPVELWQSEQKALADDVKHLESDFRDAVDRIERTSQERMTTLRGEIGTVRSPSTSPPRISTCRPRTTDSTPSPIGRTPSPTS